MGKPSVSFSKSPHKIVSGIMSPISQTEIAPLTISFAGNPSIYHMYGHRYNKTSYNPHPTSGFEMNNYLQAHHSHTAVSFHR